MPLRRAGALPNACLPAACRRCQAGRSAAWWHPLPRASSSPCQHCTCRGCVPADAVEWVRQQAAALPRVPSLAFIHIPIPQFAEAWTSGAPASGTKGELSGCPLADTGFFAVAK